MKNHITWLRISDYFSPKLYLALFSRSWSRKPSHPSWSPRSRWPLQISPSNLYYHAKSWGITLLQCENRVILTSVVLSQYTRVTDRRQADSRQTTYHDNSRTLQWNCNVQLLSPRLTSVRLESLSTEWMATGFDIKTSHAEVAELH